MLFAAVGIPLYILSNGAKYSNFSISSPRLSMISFKNSSHFNWCVVVVCKSPSVVSDSATAWTTQSLEFSRSEY